MKWKTTSQAVAEQMAKEMGITKRSAEQFTRLFIDTLVEGLQRDGVVKIKGFGTFKMVSISSRESVNVTTGERMVIAEHQKVSFTPAEEITTQLTSLVADSGTTKEPAEQQPQSETNTHVPPTATNSEPHDKASNFDGIDDIIATPESEIPQANGEKEQDSQANQPAEVTAEQTPNETIEEPTVQPLKLEEKSQEQNTELPESPVPEPTQKEQEEHQKTHKKSWLLILLVLLIILIGVLTYIFVLAPQNSRTNCPIPTSPKVESPRDAQPPVQKSETQSQKAKTPTHAQKDTQAESKPSRPKTYILQKGQSITDVSVLFYGTKDSMQAIIRANNFRDPNNVYVGTEIKLP